MRQTLTPPWICCWGICCLEIDVGGWFVSLRWWRMCCQHGASTYLGSCDRAFIAKFYMNLSGSSQRAFIFKLCATLSATIDRTGSLITPPSVCLYYVWLCVNSVELKHMSTPFYYLSRIKCCVFPWHALSDFQAIHNRNSSAKCCDSKGDNILVSIWMTILY